MLRTIYTKGQQAYQATIKVPELICLNGLTAPALEKKLTELQSQFDLTTGPLWQVAYIDGYKDERARLWFALHHLIVDAVSWRILLEDCYALYQGKCLGVKTSSYRQWVATIGQYAETHQAEKAYWQAMLTNLPVDTWTKGPLHQHQVTLTIAETNDLLRHANQAYHTQANCTKVCKVIPVCLLNSCNC